MVRVTRVGSGTGEQMGGFLAHCGVHVSEVPAIGTDHAVGIGAAAAVKGDRTVGADGEFTALNTGLRGAFNDDGNLSAGGGFIETIIQGDTCRVATGIGVAVYRIGFVAGVPIAEIPQGLEAVAVGVKASGSGEDDDLVVCTTQSPHLLRLPVRG